MAIARSFRDGWLTSLTVDKLRDDSAELFLFRLGLKADKNGVYFGDPELLRAAVYPLQVSRRRLADVARYRDKCAAAGLLRLWTAADGRPYVQILKFQQKTPNERPQHPLPPGEPDDTGQEQLGLPDPPPALSLSKAKERKVRVAQERTAPKAPTHTHESKEACLKRLSETHPDVNIAAQLKLAERHVKQKRGETAVLDLKYFEEKWLPGCAHPVNVGAISHELAGKGRVSDDPAPDGWREMLADTPFGPGGANEVHAWGQLDATQRQWVRDQLAMKETTGSREVAA